jgi:hypothetical protein
MIRRFTVVLGMHRSGTSALAGALRGLGARLGDALVPAADDNPGGYFENAAMVSINESLLLDLERGWDDPRPLPGGWLASSAARSAARAIDALLDAEFAEGTWHALKDPRLCRLLPLWRPLLEARGRVEALFALRSPDAVVASLHRRDRMAPEEAMRLLAIHLSDADRGSRGLVRASVDYDRLLQSPGAELLRIAERLHWPPTPPEVLQAVSVTLDAAQRTHAPGRVASPAVASRRWAEAVHAALLDVDAPETTGAPSIDLVDPPHAPADDAASLEGLRWALVRERRRARALERTLARTDDAYAVAERRAIERLSEAATLDARLADAHAGLQRAESLALERLEELGAIASALERCEALARKAVAQRDEAFSERDEAVRRLDQAVAEAVEARAELARLRASRTWRWTEPVRRLARWMRSLRG